MAVDVGTALAYLDLDISPFERGIKSAMSNLKTFMDSSQSATDRIGALGSAFTTVGGTLTKNVTTPIVALGTAAVAMASDFEKSMSNVKAISQATDTQFQELKDTALSLGASTAFSAGEVADAMTEMAKAGWTSQQIIVGMSGVLDAAAASGEGLAAVSTIVADAITGFGMDAEDSSKVADLLTQAANSGTIGINDLGESFKYIAPIAKSLNINIEDTVTAISAMSLAGIKGSQAGTSLRTMLTRMVKPTKMVQEAMEQLGFSAKNADGTFKELPDILSELRVKFADLTDAQKAQYAAQLAGQEGMSGLLSILNLTQEEYDEIERKMYESKDVAQITAEVMQDNLASSMEQLGGAIETLAIKIGDALLPTIRDITEFVTSVVEKITQLDNKVIEQIVRIAAIVAAIGPLLLVVGKVISGVSMTMSLISALASPIGIVIALIAGLAAILVNLYQTNDEFRTKVNETWSEVVSTLSTAIENIKQVAMTLWEGLKPSLQMLGETFGSVKEQLGSSFIKLIDEAKEAFVKWQPIIELLGKVLGAVFLTVISTVIAKVNGLIKALVPIVDIITSVISIIGELGALIVAVFSGDFEAAKESIANIWNEILSIFDNAILAVQEFLSGFSEGFIETMDNLFGAFGVEGVGQMFEQIKATVSNFINSIVESIVNFVTVTVPEFVNSVREFFTSIPEYFSSLLESIKSWFAELPENIAYTLGLIVGKFAEWGISLLEWIATELPVIVDNVVAFFSSLPEKIWAFLLDIVTKVIAWGVQLKEDMKSTAKQAVENVITFFVELPEKIYSFLLELIENVISWKDDMIEYATSTGQDFLNSLVEFFKSLPDKIKELLNKVVEKVKSFKNDMVQAGKDLMNGLWDGLKSAWKGVSEWFDGIKEKFTGLWDSFKSGFDDAQKQVSQVNGSHANGLDYVPYNGYIAELHEGERVLTKAEAEVYNENTSSNTFNFYGTQKLDQRQTVEEFKDLLRQFDILGGV